MHVAVITDTHANLPALEAALTNVDELAIDRVVCSGDVVGYGPQPSEVVLDLRSGGAIDVLLSAPRVGGGKAYGLDMTDEMLDLARRDATEAGAENVEFIEGHMEAIPLDDATVDLVISNCKINLSTDKSAVFSEIQRVLRPEGRIGIGDIGAEDRLTSAERADRGSYVGCIAGALSIGENERLLETAGFADVSVEFTHDVADGMHGAIVKPTTSA